MEQGQLLYGRRLREEGQEILVFVDQGPVGLTGGRGQVVHGLDPAWIGLLGMVVGARLEDRGEHGVEVASSQAADAVLEGDYLSLLCYSDLAVQGAWRLGHDRLIAGTAASTGAASASMEEAQLYAVLAGQRGEESLCLVQGPVARNVARVLAGIAVAEHDLLQVPAAGHRRSVEWVLQQAPQHVGRPLQVLHGLEEGSDAQEAPRAPAALVRLQQPRPAREQLDAEDVARLVAHAKDKGLYRRLGESVRGLPDAFEGFEHLNGGFGDVIWVFGERPWIGDQAAQERRAVFFGHVEYVLARARGHQLCGRLHNPGTLLANVEFREVEAEDLRLADQVSKTPLGDPLVPVALQASVDDAKVIQEVRHARVGRLSPGVLERAPQALGHEQELPAVDLVGIVVPVTLHHLGHEPFVALYGLRQLLRDCGQLRRLAHVLGQGQGRGTMALQDQLAVEGEGRAQGLGPDERVPVLVPADPGAEAQDPPEARGPPRKAAGQFVLELPVHFEGRGDQGVLEEPQRTLYLVLDLGSADP